MPWSNKRVEQSNTYKMHIFSEILAQIKKKKQFHNSLKLHVLNHCLIIILKCYTSQQGQRDYNYAV